MQWIDINIELPEITDQLIVLVENRVAMIAKFNGDGFTDDELEIEDVTHWCYLPKILKSQSNE
jgi:hypothetical protein